MSRHKDLVAVLLSPTGETIATFVSIFDRALRSNRELTEKILDAAAARATQEGRLGAATEVQANRDWLSALIATPCSEKTMLILLLFPSSLAMELIEASDPDANMRFGLMIAATADNPKLAAEIADAAIAEEKTTATPFKIDDVSADNTFGL